MTRQERAARTRNELLQAAAAQFEHHGYADTTLHGICRQAGVSSGALHFHFAGKAAIADAVEDATANTLQRLVSMPRPRRAGALQELVDVSQLLGDQLVGDQIVRSGIRLSLDASREGRLPLHKQWRSHVVALLEEARADGSLAPEVAVADAASAVVLATEGAVSLGCCNGDWSVVNSLTRFWRIVLPQLAGADFADRMEPCGTVLCDRCSSYCPGDREGGEHWTAAGQRPG